MGGKVSISPRGEELVIFRGDRAIMKEIFQASKERIAQMNKAGVAQGRTGIAEPERQHLPVLTNMEEYKDWVKKATSYVMDKRLARKNENDQIVGREIEIENIFQPVITRNGKTKKCRHVMILGAAGMGKTTILRRIALYCGEEMLKGKLVIMLDFRTLPLKEKMCPSEVLQANIFSDRDSERMKLRYQWILDNRDKIVFIIDSLDTLPFDLDNKRPRIGYHTPATVDVILHNLLARELFPKSCIVSSSREYKVRNLHPSVQPDRCILLDGLKEDSVKDLIDGFLGEEKGTKVKEHINTKCPDIWPLLSIPVVMIFSVIGFVQDGFKPATLSGILIKFFTCLIRSTHAHVKDILSVLKKLMPLALEGIRKGFVLFTPEDLKRFGLEPEEVTDLGILIPQSHGTFFSTKLMQNDRFFLYFNHQTEQEALAALQILSLCLVEFNTFVECEIWEIQFTVVRRLICGSLMNDEVLDAAQEITEISDVDQKKNILLRSLGVALKKYQQENEGAKLLELFIDLSECREGATELIRSSVKKINFEDTSLSPSDVQAVAFVMKQCEYLKGVNLNSSNLNGEKVKILATTITRSNFKLKKLDVDHNDIGSGGMFHLGRFVQNSTLEELSVNNCGLESEHLQKFAEGAQNATLKKLHVGNNNIGSGGMFHLGRFVKNSTLEELSMNWCSLESEHLQKFAEGAQNATLKKLDVEGNSNIGSGGMFHLGRFVKNSTLEELSTRRCSLRSEHLEKFAEGAANAELKKLNVDENDNIGSGGMFHLGRFVKNSTLEELSVNICGLESEHLQKFAEGAQNARLKKLDVSHNWSIDSGGMFHLGRFVKNSTLEELSVRSCGLESEHLQKFAKGAANAELKILHVDENENIGSGGMFHLGRFVKNSTLEELSVTECGLKSEHLEKFAEGAQNATLKKLDVDRNNIGSGGMFHLGRFVKNSTLEELSAWGCSLESEHLQKFAEGAQNATLKKLNVGGNRNIGSGGMFHLGRFVKNSTLEEVSARLCGLESEHLQKFAEGAQNATLKKLNVNNNNIGSGGMFHLGRFVKNSTLEELSAQHCFLRSEHLEKFAEGAENAEFRKLDVSQNEDLGPEGMRLFGKLVKHHEVNEVLARSCNSNEENVQKFAEGLGEAKFDFLDLSYAKGILTKFGKPVYVPSLLNLLPRVNKEIKLQGWKINEIQQRELQDKLNRICSPTLSITLGEEENTTVLKTRDSETENQVELPTSEETPVGSSTGSSTDGPSTGDEEMGTGQLEDDPDTEVKITSKENDDKSESITTTEESKDSAEGKTTEISDEQWRRVIWGNWGTAPVVFQSNKNIQKNSSE